MLLVLVLFWLSQSFYSCAFTKTPRDANLELKLDGREEITDYEVVNARLHIYDRSSASDDDAGWWDSDSDGPDNDADDLINANIFAHLFFEPWLIFSRLIQQISLIIKETTNFSNFCNFLLYFEDNTENLVRDVLL